jgi:hypothetical protein
MKATVLDIEKNETVIYICDNLCKYGDECSHDKEMSCYLTGSRYLIEIKNKQIILLCHDLEQKTILQRAQNDWHIMTSAIGRGERFVHFSFLEQVLSVAYKLEELFREEINPKRYVMNFPVRQEVTVLGADEPRDHIVTQIWNTEIRNELQ